MVDHRIEKQCQALPVAPTVVALPAAHTQPKRSSNGVERVSPLRAHAEELEAFLEEHPPRTLEQACDLIEKLTGIRRLKTGIIPAKADFQKQEEFF